MRIGLWIATMGVALATGPVWAADRALVLGNENYADAADIAGARGLRGAAQTLNAAGYQVLSGADLGTDGMRALLSDLLSKVQTQDRLVIVLAGHFAQSAGQTWFLGVEASQPDLVTVGAAGVNLASVLELAARSPGGAVVLLGSESRRLPLGAGLQPGIGALTVPQGVTLIRGDAGRIADFAARQMTERGASLPALLSAAPDLIANGFLAPGLPFRPDSTGATVQAPPPVAAGQNAAERTAEDLMWGNTRKAATLSAYDAYLARYPSGRYAALARAEVARMRADPVVQAMLAEESMGLTRDQRRAIQRQLSLLGHNPRGIDGLFGPGSRNAISAWQTANRETATGYLTRDQTTRLAAQADRRAAELEAEAVARKAEQDRQDQLYWNQTGAAGDEAGLRAYLKRNPDGIFAEVAAERLAAIDAARRDQAAAQDRAAWDRASAANIIASYRDYLTTFPQGAFAAEATARIEALQDQAQGRPDRARAEATEAALGLNNLARTLIERRLEGLGFNPGEADGTFDDRTRRAIRRFQTARNLSATGYLDQQSMVALLAGGALTFGE